MEVRRATGRVAREGVRPALPPPRAAETAFADRPRRGRWASAGGAAQQMPRGSEFRAEVLVWLLLSNGGCISGWATCRSGTLRPHRRPHLRAKRLGQEDHGGMEEYGICH